ncbi:hypothetical protein PHLGIDRAFT_128094 [Phlebiopsis gigantea 11061_1 CR5-6]|uniref:Uncharacterized protein n=1 Tax=Phlebiopsis gigantea (strain 11061_1 CR5-6) TaxID=745531 RepID=A0A0C3PKE7_PHLG1|nr:hypothetical protein PHLGIDRAFT_128094 [Phlebiopsis gigantea 11061_1 CR5-6]
MDDLVLTFKAARPIHFPLTEQQPERPDPSGYTALNLTYKTTTPRTMGNQDDHHDPHVTSLRILLGSILSPKRAAYTRSSSSTPGTDSPAFHSSQPASPELPHRVPPHAHASPAPRAVVSRSVSAPVPTLTRATSSESGPVADGAATPDAVDAHRRTRHDLMGSLQSKNTAWDALIHGAFV